MLDPVSTPHSTTPLNTAQQPSLPHAVEMSHARLVADLHQIWTHDLFQNVIPFWQNFSIDFVPTNTTATNNTTTCVENTPIAAGYLTCLSDTGACYDHTKYVWLQAREVWMFAHLFVETIGETRTIGGAVNATGKPYISEKERIRLLECALHGIDFLQNAKDERGRIWFSLSRDGKQKIHYQRKPYAAVFYAMAHLEVAFALKTAANLNLSFNNTAKCSADKYAIEAIEMFNNIREWMNNPVLVGNEDFVPADSSCLANVMCLGILALQFLRCVDNEWGTKIGVDKSDMIAEIATCLKKLENHFDQKYGVFLENATTNGTDLTTPHGRLFNPGHSIETAWVLLEMCRFSQNQVHHKKMALCVLENSLELGWDVVGGGGLVYVMDVEGREMLDATVDANAKLWWPHSEALIALMRALHMDPNPKWANWLVAVHTYTYNHFACTNPVVDSEILEARQRKRTQLQQVGVGGGEGGGDGVGEDGANGEDSDEQILRKSKGKEWFGYCARDGSISRRYVGGNYKGCFHVPRALWMCVKEANEMLCGLQANAQHSTFAEDMENQIGTTVVQAVPVPMHGIARLGDSISNVLQRTLHDVSVDLGAIASASVSVSKDVSKKAEDAGLNTAVRNAQQRVSQFLTESGVSGAFSNAVRSTDKAINKAATRAADKLDTLTIKQQQPPSTTTTETTTTQATTQSTTSTTTTSNDSEANSTPPPPTPRRQFIVYVPPIFPPGHVMTVQTPEGYHVSIEVPQQQQQGNKFLWQRQQQPGLRLGERSLLVEYRVVGGVVKILSVRMRL